MWWKKQYQHKKRLVLQESDACILVVSDGDGDDNSSSSSDVVEMMSVEELVRHGGAAWLAKETRWMQGRGSACHNCKLIIYLVVGANQGNDGFVHTSRQRWPPSLRSRTLALGSGNHDGG
jgi:hypothetical protein